MPSEFETRLRHGGIAIGYCVELATAIIYIFVQKVDVETWAQVELANIKCQSCHCRVLRFRTVAIFAVGSIMGIVSCYIRVGEAVVVGI